MAAGVVRLAESALMEQTTVVKDKDEALDFLHAARVFPAQGLGAACRGGDRSKRAQAHGHGPAARHP